MTDAPRPRHLLLDLDGTLIGLNMETFVPAMVSSMMSWFAPVIPGSLFLTALSRGFRSMTMNDDPDRNLLDIFLDTFTRSTALAPDEVVSRFDTYYRGPFRDLAVLAMPVPGVAALLGTAEKAGCRLTLATKPIFPASAIRERMAWAGLDESLFELITTAETMHFCKPRPGYWREILHRLGAEPTECLMAGNDLSQDLLAREVGIPVFIVREGYETGEGKIAPDRQGTLADLAAWLG
jgi:FMN phosphatase YigB (HAD superfamily)